MIKTSVIVPIYNGERCLPGLLDDLAAQTARDFEVILIDDASGDNSAAAARASMGNRPDWTLLRNPENLGFVHACYRGMERARGEYLSFLNYDTRVDRAFVEKLGRLLDEDAGIGVLGCRVVDGDGGNWFSGGVIQAGIPRILTDDFSGLRDVDWVAGTAVFYRRDVLNQLGFWKKEYFMYHEDAEFCLRMRRETSYRSCIFSEPLVTHLTPGRSLSVDRHFYYHYRNLVLFQKEYFPWFIPLLLFVYVSGNLLREALSAHRPEEKRGYWAGCLRGTLDGLAGRSGRDPELRDPPSTGPSSP